jgi:hypothetical protein
VKEFYDWDYVVDRYEELFAKMSGQPLPVKVPAVESLENEPQKASVSRSASA